jgi:hypothetical protein
VTKI